MNNATERLHAVDACLGVSLRHLEEFTLTRYRAQQRYQELVIFPEDTDIPLKVLQRFWYATEGLEMWEVEDICIRLHRLSLLLTCDLSNGTIRLHGVLHSYLEQHTGQTLPTLHAQFLDAYRQGLGVTHWADIPREDSYLWQHLIWHLCQSGRLNEVQFTLTDLSYLAYKVLYAGVSALESDLQLAMAWSSSVHNNQHTPPAAEPGLSLLEPLHRIVVRYSHLLRRASTLAEIGGLLLSYLGWEKPFVTQRQTLESVLSRPFLTTYHPLLTNTSEVLRRTLHGHTGRVHGCAISPDGTWIVSASGDHTLKVWDAVTGEERLTLRGHTDWVRGCAISPDGTWIVSASGDHTLKVWDAVTGEEQSELFGHASMVSGCAISPDGTWIISVSSDHTLKLWYSNNNRCICTFPTDGELYNCAFHPDGKHLVVCGGQGLYFLRLEQ
jgi:hypothetical protein